MARPHHYEFAHKLLPQLFFENPMAFTAALLDKGEQLLKEVWNRLGDELEASNADGTRLQDIGLSVCFDSFSNKTHVSVVIMPEPQEPPEAYFVALAVKPPSKRLGGLLGERKSQTRVITLEYGIEFTGDEGSTVICEWTQNGTHLNRGNGPDAEIDAFIKVVSSMLK